MHATVSTGRRCGRAAVLACLALIAHLAPPAFAAEIRIGGTGNALGTMRLLGIEFVKLNPGVTVTVLPSIGSSGAVRALPKGAIDIGVSSRPLTQEERNLGLTSLEYARSPLVFAVASNLAVTTISFDQIADIYSGGLTHWPDGSRIRLVLRQAGDDNTLLVKQMSPAIERALTSAERLPGMAFATTDQEAADKIEQVPGALGTTTLALLISEGRPLKPLALNGVEPTVANGASGKYPYAKRFFLLTRIDPSAEVKDFIQFLRTSAGRDVLARTGHWVP